MTKTDRRQAIRHRLNRMAEYAAETLARMDKDEEAAYTHARLMRDSANDIAADFRELCRQPGQIF